VGRGRGGAGRVRAGADRDVRRPSAAAAIGHRAAAHAREPLARRTLRAGGALLPAGPGHGRAASGPGPDPRPCRTAAAAGRAARFFRLDPVTGAQRPARAQIRARAERLLPLAERLGDEAALAGVERLLQRGNAAAAMRAVLRREGSFPAVTRWVAEQTVGSA